MGLARKQLARHANAAIRATNGPSNGFDARIKFAQPTPRVSLNAQVASR